MQPLNWHFLLSAKMNGGMHCTNCGMPKGTSWAEAKSNSERIKLIALAIVI